MTKAKPKTSGPDPRQQLFDRLAEIAEFDEQDQLEAENRIDADSFEALVALAQEQLHCTDEEERLSSEAKQYRERKDDIRINLIPELMKKLGLVGSNGKGSFTFAGGKVNLESSIKASCTVANKPKLFAWLRRNNLGTLIKEDVSATSLASLVKDRRSDGLTDPPNLSIFELVKAKITRAKG